MGAALHGIGYGLASAGKGVGRGFQYANANIPGGFRGAAVRILTQDPLAGRPDPNEGKTNSVLVPQAPVAYPQQAAARVWTGGQAEGDMSGQVYGGVNPGTGVVPGHVLAQAPPVAVPVRAGQQATTSRAALWDRYRYAQPIGSPWGGRYGVGIPYDSRYPGSYPMDEGYPGRRY